MMQNMFVKSKNTEPETGHIAPEPESQLQIMQSWAEAVRNSSDESSFSSKFKSDDSDKPMSHVASNCLPVAPPWKCQCQEIPDQTERIAKRAKRQGNWGCTGRFMEVNEVQKYLLHGWARRLASPSNCCYGNSPETCYQKWVILDWYLRAGSWKSWLCSKMGWSAGLQMDSPLYPDVRLAKVTCWEPCKGIFFVVRSWYCCQAQSVCLFKQMGHGSWKAGQILARSACSKSCPWILGTHHTKWDATWVEMVYGYWVICELDRVFH